MGLFRRKPSVDPDELAAVAGHVAAVAGEVAALRAQLDVLGKRLDSTDTDRHQVVDLVAALQHRVASIGSELTNQLSELSGDIDALQARPDPAAAIAAADGLRSGQERLANEQARYQIAFRDDLAALADQINRKRA